MGAATFSKQPWLWAAGIIVAALLLHLGGLSAGLEFDDPILTKLIAARIDSQNVPGEWHEVAGLRNPDGPAGIARDIAAGRVPWWTDPEGAWSMFRPAAVVTHYIDMWFWPASPVLMHVQNMVWLGFLFLSVWWLFRRLCERETVALFGLALFAFAARNGEMVSWISARNSVMMVAFAALALAVHDRARRESWAPGRFLAPLFLLLSLWSSEGGVSLWGALLGYALWVDRGKLAARAVALAPMAAVTAGWLLHYRLSGFGTRGGDLYLDPVGDPLAFLAAAPARLAQLALELFGLPQSAFRESWPPPGLGDALNVPAILLCVTTLLVLGWFARTDTRVRFWLFSSVLALLPLCAGAPSHRLLLLPAAFTCGALALAAAELWRLTENKRLAGRSLVAAWVAAHVLGGIILIPMTGRARTGADVLLQGLRAELPVGHGEPPLMVINTPHAAATAFALFLASDVPFGDDQHYVLGAAAAPVLLTRVAPNAIRLQPAGGYLAEPSSRAYRAANRPMRSGEQFRLGEGQLTVEEVSPDGRPLSVLLVWGGAERLEDAKLRWTTTVHDGARLRSIDVTLPKPGQSVEVPFLMPPT